VQPVSGTAEARGKRSNPYGRPYVQGSHDRCSAPPSALLHPSEALHNLSVVHLLPKLVFNQQGRNSTGLSRAPEKHSGDSISAWCCCTERAETALNYCSFIADADGIKCEPHVPWHAQLLHHIRSSGLALILTTTMRKDSTTVRANGCDDVSCSTRKSVNVACCASNLIPDSGSCFFYSNSFS
jgi:sulfur relay (sulfurtransferase) complex TusBCD TusD component (DsrE family)